MDYRLIQIMSLKWLEKDEEKNRKREEEEEKNGKSITFQMNPLNGNNIANRIYTFDCF